MDNKAKVIEHELLSWQGVTAHPHRYGGTEYRLGRREIGHVHGEYLVDIPFPKKIRDELVAAERAKPHHVLPGSGWVSFYLHQPDDVEHAIDLLRLSYGLALKQKSRAPSEMQTNETEE